MTAEAATAAGSATRPDERSWRPFVAMLPTLVVSWLVARVVVVAALALAMYLKHQASDVAGTNPFPRATGLLGWDAAFYRDLGDHGYGGLPVEARRFFPLLPLVVRVVGLGSFPGPALLLVVNLVALAFAAVLWRLVVIEGWGDETGERTVWLLVLAPPAFVLVMGYTEALAGLAAVLVFLGIRRGHWWLAAGAGAAAALCRPTGLLLCVPVLIEAVRQQRRPLSDAESRSPLLPRAAAVVAPLVGAGLYFAYLGLRFGDALQPLRIQQDARLHGPATNPLATVSHAAHGLVHGQIGTGLHVPWLILVLALLVVMARTLPASYTAWCACTIAGSLVGTNLDSFERYAWSAFPFVIVAARLFSGRPRLWQAALGVTGALLASYALLAFLGLSVP